MKCSICGMEQTIVGSGKMYFEGSDEQIGNDFPVYNTQFLMGINNKDICEKCADIYYKIYAMWHKEDFSCGGKEYFADGRNLPEN